MVGPKNIDSTPALSVAGTYQARIEVPMGGVDEYLCWGAVTQHQTIVGGSFCKELEDISNGLYLLGEGVQGGPLPVKSGVRSPISRVKNNI